MIQVAEIRPIGKIFTGKPEEVVRQQMGSALYEVTAFLEGEVKERTPQGVMGTQGGLRSTIQGDVDGAGTAVVKGVVAHQSKYGDVIEKGREPGKSWPPPGALLRWIEVKLGVDERTAKQLEFVIRRKIGRKGFEGAHMFENALNENWDTLQNIFEKHGFEIVRKLDGK